MEAVGLVISIITVNYNNAVGLEQTVNSVLRQTYPEIEYIIIDGGSNDGSKEVLSLYEKKVAYAISEPDNGVYHAMNKGISFAHGDYLLFINSGDLLINDTVIEEAISMKLDKDLVYGNVVLVEQEESRDWITDDQISFSTFYHSTIPHPGTFIRRGLFSKLGNYNDRYKIVSDWEFFLLAICKYNCSYKHIDLKICRFFLDGISADPNNYQLLFSERNDALKRHFPLFLRDYEEHDQIKEDFRRVRKYVKFKKRIKSIFKRRS